jgi:hypothetical protein
MLDTTILLPEWLLFLDLCLIVENEMNLGIRAFKCLFCEYKRA